MTVLLDANVLIALMVADHVHHDAAESWFASAEDTFATCPITQGSLIRLLVHQGQPADTAVALLAALTAHPRHEFWPDNESFEAVSLRGVIGHRQVTDAYLAHLAKAHAGRLATFDRGLSKLRDDVTDLVPILP
ncbi:MAG: PIN domain-containing protein [Jiangellaceae bacterium]|nr:PIN domain-containing protein [Jiangellaceae bacterium]